MSERLPHTYPVPAHLRCVPFQGESIPHFGIQFYDKPVRLQEGDVVAVFSNGMQESVTWKEMEDCLARKKSCKRMAFDLVELVNQKKGDKDNASVILIRVGEMT